MQITVLIFTFCLHVLHYCICVLWCPNMIWKYSICIGKHALSWGQMQVTGTTVCISILIIYVHTTYCFSPRKLVAQLQDVISKLTSPWHPQVPSMPYTAPNQDKSNTLDTPDLLQLLNQEDYPYVCYWHKDNWIKFTDRQRDSGQVPSRLGFLTDKDGSPIPES